MNKRIVGAVVSLLFCLNATAKVQIYCDRACLAGFMNRYLDALVKHDASKLQVTNNVKYSENGVRLNLNDGLWQTAAALPTYRVDVIDEYSGQVGLLGRISENGNNNWYAVRLKVELGKQISEIETLIARNVSSGSGAGFGTPNTEPHPLMMQPIAEHKRLPRALLAEIGDSYFTGLDTEESGRNVPFSPECQRRENGIVTANNPEAEKGSMQWMDCKAQFDTGFSVIVTDIRERRFPVVDPVTGLAFGWGYFDHSGAVPTMTRTQGGPQTNVSNTFRQPFSFYIAEIFKVVDGNIRQIEAVLTTVPYEMPSGW